MAEHFMAQAFAHHKGALHRMLGVPKGKKIPMSKLLAAKRKGGLEAKRANLVLIAERANRH
jgi:hypothetical protein